MLRHGAAFRRTPPASPLDAERSSNLGFPTGSGGRSGHREARRNPNAGDFRWPGLTTLARSSCQVDVRPVVYVSDERVVTAQKDRAERDVR